MRQEPPKGVRARQVPRTWTSSLTVDEFACVRAVGFEPVGQVMGGTVSPLGRWLAYPRCDSLRSTVRVASGGGMDNPGPEGRDGGYIKRLYKARDTAMGRMARECAGLGGDGVVAVRLTVAPFRDSADFLEFQAVGTAVRARGKVHPKRPFLSNVTGQECAKLIEAGWVPVDLALGVSLAASHDGLLTEGAPGEFADPEEVAGWTQLISRTRRHAREHLLRDAARTGGTGVVVSSVDLRVGQRDCRDESFTHDQVARVMIIGTSIAAFRRLRNPRRALTIMRI